MRWVSFGKAVVKLSAEVARWVFFMRSEPKERQGKDCMRSVCPRLDEKRLVGVVICCVRDGCVCLRSASWKRQEKRLVGVGDRLL